MNLALQTLIDTWFESHKGLEPSRKAIEELAQKVYDLGWDDSCAYNGNETAGI